MSSSEAVASDSTSVGAGVRSVQTSDGGNTGQMVPAAGRTVMAAIENRAMEVKMLAAAALIGILQDMHPAPRQGKSSQVGMAAMDPANMKLTLMQFVESTRTYNNSR